jgi:hypothetical protein
MNQLWFIRVYWRGMFVRQMSVHHDERKPDHEFRLCSPQLGHGDPADLFRRIDRVGRG